MAENGFGEVAMESYKHSCPVCGQHIEYTVGYCGQQMTCPMCSHSIVFPAVPPGRGKNPLRTSKTSEAVAVKKPFVLPTIFRRISEFEHWKTVLQCLIPFLLVGGLLLGASILRKRGGDDTGRVTAPVTQADPGAWNKMADLARADQVVQRQLRNLIAYNAAAVQAARDDAQVHNQYRNNTEYMTFLTAADRRMNLAQAQLAAARQAFENALLNYQKLGGTVDYRSQMPR
jgi:hypothetical protein